jgi:hypothetical protein
VRQQAIWPLGHLCPRQVFAGVVGDDREDGGHEQRDGQQLTERALGLVGDEELGASDEAEPDRDVPP